MIAPRSAVSALERQPFSVVAEIGLGVFTAEGYLTNFAKSGFAWLCCY